MKRLNILILVFSALFLSFANAQTEKKNVLFIAIDDLKPLIGSYGYEHMQTPNIDKLAAGGVLFENAHCQQAVCGPSRASLLTGMTPDYTGVWDLRTRMRNVNEDILAMPEHFKENGYETVAIGKIYDPRCVDKQYDKPSWSIPYKISSQYTYPAAWGQPALSYYVGEDSKAIVAKLTAEAEAKAIKNVHAYVTEQFKPAVECVEAPDNAYMDGQIANNGIQYLDQLSKSDKPFFLAVGFKRPHLPFAAPKKYWDLYKRDEIKLAPYQKPVVDGVDIAYHNHGEMLSYTDIPPLESFSDIFTELIPEDQQRELIHGYYASVSFIDAQVGLIMKKLKELGLDKNTTIVLWGDHGWHLGDHALWCKHTNFEQATRVPLIISTPSGDKGVYKHPVGLIDLFPTLCDASGIEIPKQLQGVSLLPGMKDVNKSVKEYAVSQFDRGKTKGYSIRTERYRYTIWMKDNYRTYLPFDENLIYDCELYDYDLDPLETKNLYRSDDYAAISKQMLNYFKAYVKKQNVALADAGSNPANVKVSSNQLSFNIDGSFNQALDSKWSTISRNGAVTNFSVVAESPIGDNALQVDITKLGAKTWDVGLLSKELTNIPAGKTIDMSFHGRGGKLKVILVSEKGTYVTEELVLGQNTYVHNLSFPIEESGSYKMKIQFMDTGVYLLDEIKTEFN